MTAVTTTPVALVSGRVLVQNLGPDDLYIGHSMMDDTPLVTEANGIRLSAGESISVEGSSSKISVVSSGTSEVRHLTTATGVYTAAAPTV